MHIWITQSCQSVCKRYTLYLLLGRKSNGNSLKQLPAGNFQEMYIGPLDDILITSNVSLSFTFHAYEEYGIT